MESASKECWADSVALNPTTTSLPRQEQEFAHRDVLAPVDVVNAALPCVSRSQPTTCSVPG